MCIVELLWVNLLIVYIIFVLKAILKCIMKQLLDAHTAHVYYWTVEYCAHCIVLQMVQFTIMYIVASSANVLKREGDK